MTNTIKAEFADGRTLACPDCEREAGLTAHYPNDPQCFRHRGLTPADRLHQLRREADQLLRSCEGAMLRSDPERAIELSARISNLAREAQRLIEINPEPELIDDAERITSYWRHSLDIAS